MNVVTLTDALLLELSKNPTARARLPLLTTIYNTIVNKGGGCGKCGRRRKLSGTVLSVRTAFATNPSAMITLKQLLNADRIIAYIRGAKGLTQRREF